MRLARYGLILVFILLPGLLLRIYNLGTEGIWLDEGISLKLAHADIRSIAVERVLNNHPPLYFIVLHYWINLFGDSVFSARFLSLLFGLFALLLMYKLGAFVFSKDTGILSSLLLALSLFHIYYSQEIRMYSLVVFLALLSMYFFLRDELSSHRLNAAGYILASISLLYSHYSSLFILLAQNLYVITLFLFNKERSQPNIQRWLKYQATLFLSYLPWFWVRIMHLEKLPGSHFGLPRPSLLSIINSFVEYSGSVALLVIFIILLAFLLLPFRKEKANFNLPDTHKFYLLLLWLFIPHLALFVISWFTTPLYETKYTIAALPAFYLLIALAVTRIKPKEVKVFIIALISLLCFIGLGRYYSAVKKIPWMQIADYIEENAQPGDLLIFNDFLCQRNVFNYYFKRVDVDKRLFPHEWPARTPFVALNADNINELKRLTQDYERAWIILSHTTDDNMLIKERFSNLYTIAYHKIYPALSYLTYKRRDATEVFLLQKY